MKGAEWFLPRELPDGPGNTRTQSKSRLDLPLAKRFCLSVSRRDHIFIGPNAQSSVSIHSSKGGEHNEPGFVYLRGERDRAAERSEREENRTRESGEEEPRKTKALIPPFCAREHLPRAHSQKKRGIEDIATLTVDIS